MLRLIIQTKKRYKKIVKQKVKTNKEEDTNDRAALVTKATTDKAQSLTKTRTVTCHSRVILTKRLVLQRLKKKIG